MPRWLERTIEGVAPGVAAKRAQARASIAQANVKVARSKQVLALYEAASYGRRTAGWRGPLTDANTETRFSLVRLRSVARDMRRNNPIAARGCAVISVSVVGAGITPTVRSATDARSNKVGELIKAHFESTDIDADGRHNLYGLQNLAMNTIVEAGEVLIRKRIRRASDGYALPFQVQVLEPDYLDSNVDGPQNNGNYAVQGVEFDLRGKRVAYYLFDQHPGSMSLGISSGFKSQRVSADFVAHVYRCDRPGQVRGVTWFAPVIVRMQDYKDFTDAQLLRQKIAACFGVIVTTADGNGPALDDQGNPLPVSATGINIESIEPGSIQYAREGETVSFTQPPQVGDFGAFSNVTFHEIASGLGITYEELTGDLSQATYSGGRLGHLSMDRNIDSWRWNMLVPSMLDPIQAWTQEAAAVATGSSEPFTLDWTPPERILIDPQTENEASKDAIRNGLSSRSEEVRKRGLDPVKLDEEVADDNKRADALGLIYDSDPRAVSGRGVSQKADATGPSSPKQRNLADQQADQG